MPGGSPVPRANTTWTSGHAGWAVTGGAVAHTNVAEAATRAALAVEVTAAWTA
jgi:hypothetical protein